MAFQAATELLGTAHLGAFSPPCSGHKDENVDIFCHSTKQLFSHRRNTKPVDAFKIYQSLIKSLFSDHVLAVCSVVLHKRETGDQCEFNALLHPFENGSAALHIIPEMSEMDIERISSMRGESNTVSPFAAPVGTSPGIHMFHSVRDGSPNELSNNSRASPNFWQPVKSLHPQRLPVGPACANGILQDKLGKKKAATPSDATVGTGHTSVSSSRLLRRIGSLNSLLRSKQAEPLSRRDPGLRPDSAFNSSSNLTNLRPHSEPILPVFVLTPDDHGFSPQSGSEPQVSTGSTIIYTPLDVAAYSRPEQDHDTSPTVRYNLSDIKSGQIGELFRSPGSSAPRAELEFPSNTPLQMDTSSMLFYSPASFTHDYVIGDGDGSRSLLMDLADHPMRADNCRPSGSTFVAAKSPVMITKHQSLFSLIMACKSDDNLASRKDDTSVPPKMTAESQPRDMTDAILSEMNKNLAAGVPCNTYSAAISDEMEVDEGSASAVDFTPEQKHANTLKGKIIQLKYSKNKKMTKLFESNVINAVQKCVALRSKCPMSSAKELCRLIEKAYARQCDNKVDASEEVLKGMLFDCMELLEALSDKNLMNGNVSFDNRHFAVVIALNMFFIVESVKLFKAKVKSHKFPELTKKQYKKILRRGSAGLSLCIDQIGLLFQNQDNKLFYEYCDVRWILSLDESVQSKPSDTEERILKILAARMSLTENEDAPISFKYTVYKIFCEIYLNTAADLIESLNEYETFESTASKVENVGSVTKSDYTSVSGLNQQIPMKDSAAGPATFSVFLMKSNKKECQIAYERSRGNSELTGSEDRDLDSHSLFDNQNGLFLSELDFSSQISAAQPVGTATKKVVNSLIGTSRRNGVNGNRTGVENLLRRTVSASNSKSNSASSNAESRANTSSSGIISRGPGLKSSRPPVPMKKAVPALPKKIQDGRINSGLMANESTRNENGKRPRGYRNNVVESTPLAKLKR